MNKLLIAGFARLKKDKMFWFGILFMIFISAFVVIKNSIDYATYGYTFELKLDNYFFGFAMFIGILSSLFCSLFIGTDYSDGTIRNKIVTGHSRFSIYFSNLIVCATAALLFNFAFIVAVSAAGIPLIGFLQADAKVVLQLLLTSIFLTFAYVSLFTLVGMLIQSKTNIVIASILSIAAMFYFTNSVDQRLRQPEFSRYYEYDEKGTLVKGDEEDQYFVNPEYLQPKQRVIYQFIYDFLPTGQGVQISSGLTDNLYQKQLYSLVIILASTSIGLFLFKRKDLK